MIRQAGARWVSASGTADTATLAATIAMRDTPVRGNMPIRPVDWIIPIAAALVLLATGIKARAADPPKLPAGVTCSDVRERVAEHGLAVAIAWAVKQGYSWREIRDAKRCLR